MTQAIGADRPLTVLTGDAVRPRSVWPWLGGIPLLAAAALLLASPWSDQSRQFTRHFSTVFVSIVLEAMPFVMLGALIGGVIEVFVSRERLAKLLPRRRSVSIFAAGALGLVMPVCECAIIPVTRRLVRKGVPFSTAAAYLLAGPIVNPLVAASTAVAYAGQWQIVAIRLGAGYVVACVVALAIDRLFPGDAALRSDFADQPAACSHGCGHDHEHHHHHASLGSRMVDALRHAADDFLMVGQFLVIGAFIAAMLQTTPVRQTLLDMSSSPATSIGAMMTMAVMLNLCSEADAFVAASFRTVLPLSAQLAFLVLGPMLDLKLVAMYLSFVRTRPLVVLIALIVVSVFVVMLGLHGWMEGLAL